MKPASRRTFLAIVFTSVMATAAEAWAGIFRRCRLHRRRTSCQCSCTPCETCTKAAAHANGQKEGCENRVCLQDLLAEVQEVNGKCVYRLYMAHRCLSGGGYEEVNLERDCNYNGNLPEASCSDTNGCTSCAMATGSIEVPVLPDDRDAQPAGQKHRADKELATKGTELLGHHCEPKMADAKVVDCYVVELKDDKASDAPEKALAKLAWIELPSGDHVGIGFEITEGQPTPALKVKEKALVKGEGGKTHSYTVTTTTKEGISRHFVAYMQR